jgi:hypothetical protein
MILERDSGGILGNTVKIAAVQTKINFLRGFFHGILRELCKYFDIWRLK